MSSVSLINSLVGYTGIQEQGMQITAKNISNANVPGYKTEEIIPFSFDSLVSANNNFSMAVTSPKHIQHETKSSLNARIQKKRNLEENTISGNNVSLIDETQKAKEAQMNHKLATLMYQTVMNFSSIAMGSGE